jgi:L-threonylcarbamoyladenylate synthase
MKTEVLLATDPSALRYAHDVLRNNGLVAFPTDTVYGVGALAFKPEAVQRLYIVKGRATDKAIAILVARSSDLLQVAQTLTPVAQKLALKFWPGPLTLVVSKYPGLPQAVSALATVGVRQPDHLVAQKLLELTGPLAVTSANRSGEPNSLTAADVLAQLNGRIDLIIDGGPAPGGIPSTVVDCTGLAPAILRAGPVTAADIEQAMQ